MFKFSKLFNKVRPNIKQNLKDLTFLILQTKILENLEFTEKEIQPNNYFTEKRRNVFF